MRVSAPGSTAELPRPTGPFAVGRLARDWIDPARIDPYARRGGTREIAAVIWYPAVASAGESSAPYLPRSWRLHAAMWGVAARRVVTHARHQAPIASGEERYPVLMFSPAGWAPYFYAAVLEELASHGYIVVALAHTHEMIPTTVFADGRRRWFRKSAVASALTVSKRPHADDVRDRGAVVDYKADDLRFALDELGRLDVGRQLLAGRIDIERVGVFGHSFGGAAAVVACQTDSRFAACANLDGGLWRAPERAAVDRPCLLVFAEHPEMTQPCAVSVDQKMFSSVEWCEEDRALHLACWQRLVDSARPGTCVQIRGSEHRTFMDWKLLPLRPWSIGRMGHATIDGRSMWEATTRCLLALFDEHVRGVPAISFEDLASQMIQIVVGSPRSLLEPTT
jgi:Platelet-activating factor acetylhydrolase, isoform II